MSFSDKFGVVDPGSGYIKAGIAGTALPSLCIPTVVGYTKMSLLSLPDESQKRYYGLDAIRRSSLLHLKYPIESGVINQWEDCFGLFGQVYSATETPNLILAEPPVRSKKEREILVEYLFEQAGVLGLFIGSTPVFSLYATGKVTGLVLDSGECLTSCIGIYEGIPTLSSLLQFSFGGRDLNDKLIEVLQKHHKIALLTTAQKEYARLIKEEYCTMAEKGIDYSNTNIKEAKLPDGKTVTLTEIELQSIPELIFHPELCCSTGGMVSEYGGFVQTLMESIEKCGMDTRPTLIKNIILCGGNTCFAGLPNRLHNEIRQLIPFTSEIKIEASENRVCSAWCGGSILGQLSSTKEALLTKALYEEKGISILQT